MAGPAWNPSGAVRFDLKSGAASDGAGGRVVLLPASAVEALERTTPAALVDVGAGLGRAAGARVAGRLGGDAGVRASTLEVVVSHLAGELAVAGVGVVQLERWGRALVIVVENAVVGSDAFLGAALAAALAAAAGQDVSIAPLGRDGGAARYLVASAATAARVRALLGAGKSWPDVLGALHEPRKGAS
jgi:hypothetical protein